MDVYVLDAKIEDFQDLVAEDERALDVVETFDGRVLAKDWDPINVEFLRDESNQGLPMGDFPALEAHVPVFSKHAVEALRDLLDPNGEILPVRCREGDYFAFNVTTVIDALDQQRSDVVVFEDDPDRVMEIETYSFYEDRLDGAIIFKLPERVSNRVFVTQHFVDRVHERGLSGFQFIPAE